MEFFFLWDSHLISAKQPVTLGVKKIIKHISNVFKSAGCMSTTSHQQLSCAFPCVLTATVPAGISLHQQFLCSGVLSFSFFPPLLSFSCSVDPTHFTNFISFNIAALVFDQRVSLAPPPTHLTQRMWGNSRRGKSRPTVAFYSLIKVAVSRRSKRSEAGDEKKKKKRSPVTLRVRARDGWEQVGDLWLSL